MNEWQKCKETWRRKQRIKTKKKKIAIHKRKRERQRQTQISTCYCTWGQRAGSLCSPANGAAFPSIFHRTHLHLLWPRHSTSLPHLSPTSVGVCAAGIMTCIDQRCPQWAVLLRQGWEETGEGGEGARTGPERGALCCHPPRRISQSNIHLGRRLPGRRTLSKSDLLPWFLSAVTSLFSLSKVLPVTDLQTWAKYYWRGTIKVEKQWVHTLPYRTWRGHWVMWIISYGLHSHHIEALGEILDRCVKQHSSTPLSKCQRREVCWQRSEEQQ